MINNVTLVGRLTRDPELRYTPSNVAVATFSANQSSMENQMPPSFGASDPMDISDDGLPF